jgi:hypothetical protein
MNLAHDITLSALNQAIQALVVTPPPDPRESAVGYCFRLAAANGYESPHKTLRPLDLAFPQIDRGGDVIGLRALSGLEKKTLQRLVIEPAGYKTLAFFGHKIRSSELPIRHQKVCLQCLATDGVYDASWHLRLMTYCPVHRCALVDQCHACKRTLKMSRRTADSCKCGVTLRPVDAPYCSPESAELLMALRAAVFQDKGIAPFPTSLLCFQHAGLEAMISLVRSLINFVTFPDSLPKTQQDVVRADANRLHVVASALLAWKAGISEVQAHLTAHDADHLPDTSRGLDFSWFDGKSSDLARFHDLQFIKDAISPHLAPRFITRTGLPYLHDYDPNPEWIDEQGASTLSGIPPERIAELISRNFLQKRARARVCRYVAKKDVEGLTASNSSGLSTEEAASRTGLCCKLLERLARQKLLRIRHVPLRGGIFSVEDVKKFVGRLNAIRSDILDERGQVTLVNVERMAETQQLNYSGRIKAAINERFGDD